MSVKITDAMPSGTGAIVNGCSLYVGYEILGIATTQLGSGTVSAYGDYAFAASGSYSFDELGYSGSGTWSFSIISNDGGETYAISWDVTGTYSSSGSSPVSPSESGSGTDTTITWSTGSFSLVQSYQNDTWTQKAKLFLAFTLDGHNITLDMYNLSYYSS
ncbi:MAG: VCBS domain-containing protein [Bacteroidetes bacterium]|nr:VCBS domain-containing protein [Bacteroidota bacterium]